MADETKGLGQLPLWVQAVSIVGFPVMVAAFYMAKDVGVVKSPAEASAEILKDLVLEHKGQTDLLASLVRIGRAMCHQSAKTNEDHARCL